MKKIIASLLMVIFASVSIYLMGFKASETTKMPVNLIYIINKPFIYEWDWLKEVLSEFDVKEFRNNTYDLFLDNSIIVISSFDTSNEEELFNNYLKKLQSKNCKFGVIHTSDELYSASTDFYDQCKFVLRNYWHKKFKDYPNVTYFPLGYKQGFWKDSDKVIKDSFHRDYAWSFAGQVRKSTRIDMINNMKKIPNYFFYEIFYFDAPDSLSAEDYRDILLDSVFVPCPRGFWNLDSFRVSEALECGCIPIVEKAPLDYFEHLFGKYPFLAVESWSQAPELIKQLLANPERLEQLRLDCQQWWLEHKKMMKSQVGEVVTRSFATN